MATTLLVAMDRQKYIFLNSEAEGKRSILGKTANDYSARKLDMVAVHLPCEGSIK